MNTRIVVRRLGPDMQWGYHYAAWVGQTVDRMGKTMYLLQWLDGSLLVSGWYPADQVFPGEGSAALEVDRRRRLDMV